MSHTLIAFLRAVNVGGRVVRMEELRRTFGDLGFTGVETFIASGNVIFDARRSEGAAIERRIERALEEALGYEVSTFVRTPAELNAVASAAPFTPDVLAGAVALTVAFLKGIPDPGVARRVASLRSDLDELQVIGREIYWLCRRKQSDSRLSNAVIEKTIGGRATLRGMTTVRKLAEKIGAATM